MAILLTILAALSSVFAYVTVRRSFRKIGPGFMDSAVCALEERPFGRETGWVVSGMMGSGKSTLASSLASILDVPHIEIDQMHTAEEIITLTDSSSDTGWVAEANPWQIPPEVWSKAGAILFLDFDNSVNYLRLLSRGVERWRSEGYTNQAFRHHIVEKAIKDWGRIVFLYGRKNREGWRENGIASPKAAISETAYITCTSPAEAQILLEHISSIRDRMSVSRD